ncbi:MAG: homoserine dehydrogenase [Candidatus Methanomethylophilaceae archaeon]|nr:homoserine dehydrogenase [Candidatus Methanomethylophilaceae archaeon]MDI3542359.1 homoserine dehydrogenase [Candidatus Methanomethylophilaceae archaeon]HIJ01003.1 homoserine dehydrogenase [Candidatus Methanomethylophilaceae archaeon]
MKRMDLVIAGFGTVGQGFAEVLDMRGKSIALSTGVEPRIVGAFDSKSAIYDEEGLDPNLLLYNKASGKVGNEPLVDGVAFLESIDYDLLVEVSPTNIVTGGPGLHHMRSALGSGKHLITVNKGPLALAFSELSSIARENCVEMRYEGSVGGGMPIINLCRESLSGQEISSVMGILNGTCNFILSRMDSGLPFEQALKEAQELGYAESDPSYDIDGIDTACKVVILANSVFEIDCNIHDVDVSGITAITEEAVAMAAEQNYCIRLIGEVSKERLEVSPRLVLKGHPLSVGGTLNVAQVNTDLAGPISISGRGAGRLETASAILSDLLAIIRSSVNNK